MKKEREVKKKNSYAIWVDHKVALIACVDGNGKSITETLKSGVASRQRFRGETTNKTGMLGTTLSQQNKKQNKEHEVTKHFMKDILSRLSQPSVIIIMGPADAKYDLHRQLDKTKALKPAFVEIKTADKMKAAEVKAALADRLKRGIPV